MSQPSEVGGSAASEQPNWLMARPQEASGGEPPARGSKDAENVPRPPARRLEEDAMHGGGGGGRARAAKPHKAAYNGAASAGYPRLAHVDPEGTDAKPTATFGYRPR